MKNCLHPFTKWIFCLLAMMTINDLTAQNVRDGFCDYAINASCGVAINNQTNKGGPNVIWDYQCNDYIFSGPEKVYKITTTSVGTIQIDLSINEANIDLDILLLSDNCTTPTCIGQAITSNVNGKTEQLIYNNAPVGTYYVIVDSEVHVGTYDLLITCTPTAGCNLEYTVTPKAISCGASKGAIDVAIAWGKAPFKIAWDNADNTVWNTYTTSDKNYKIDNLPAGIYVVKVTDAMGCEVMKNNIVISNSANVLDATFSSTAAPCGSNFGWINIDVANSSPPYWVTVSGPRSGTVQATSDNIVIKDMPPGDYEISVEKGGCTKEGWVTVGSTANLDFVAEVTNASCGGKGSFWITIDGGNPTYTIEWWHKDGTSNWFQSSGKSFPINDLKAGEYTIKITDKDGCSETKKVTMGGGTLDFVLESNAATCGSKGSVWVTITAGTKDFVVEWSGPTDGWKNTDKNSFAIDDLVAGNYEINIKDSKGCQNTKWVTVADGGGNLDFELEVNNATCGEKRAIWVTVKNGNPTYTVEWWGPNTSKWATTELKSFQLKDLGAGDYTVKITDSKGCSNTKTVKINTTGNGLDLTLETLGVRCGALASLWIEVKNGTSKYGIDINGPGVNRWFEATSSKIQVTDLPAGYFTVKVTDANGCTGTKTITIEDKGGNLDVALETTDASCGNKGSSWVTIKNGTAKFIVELWGPNNTTFWAETSSSSFRLSDLAAGDYTIKITDKNGCSTTETFTIGAGGSNLSMALEVNNAGCEDNGRIWVTINGGTAGYNLKWEGPSTGETNIANNGYQINNLKAGNYTLTVKDYNGCSYSKTVTVYGIGNNLTLALESNNATCSQNGYLWADVKNGEGPYQVSWTGVVAGSMNVSNAGFQIPDLPAGNYWVSVKDKNGCSITKEVTIGNSGSNLAVDLEVNNGSCGSNGYVWVTIQNGDGPYYIAWRGPKNGEANSSSNGYQISDLPKGWYKVTVKDKHGCKVVKDIEILGGSVYTVTTQQTNAICGKNGEVWVDMNGGVAPFNISLTGPVIGNTSTNGYNYHFPSVPPGTYTLSLQDATGCVVSKALTITNSGGNLDASVETTNAVCGQGGAAWITINGNTAPYTINWTGPVTGSYISSDPGYQINNLSAGDYTISVKDNYGCYTNKSITISNTGNSLNLSLEATNASCGQKGAIWTTITGGKADYTIEWTGPSAGSLQTSTTGNRIADLSAGTYSVRVTDKNNCSTTASITIGNNVQDFKISTESTNAICGQKGWAWITMNGGSPNYNISWSGPINGSASTSQSGYRLDNLIAGTYTIIVKEYNGCEDSKTITIYDKGSDITLALEATSATCDSKGSIWATITGGTSGYSYSWTGPSTGSISTNQTGYSIENLSAGTYTVTVRDSKGCETTKSITVGNDVQNFTISTESTNAICGQKGSTYITMNGGSPNYMIKWSGPLSGTINSMAGYRLDNLVAGTYTITVKDAKGCEDTKTVIIIDKGSDITLTLEATSATCDSKGSIWATISGGTSGYNYSWTGPSTGSISTSQTGYSIENLTAGTYTVTVRDSKGCETTKSVTVGNDVQNFTISTESTNATCGQKGWAYITMNGGSPNYNISWSGPSSGSVNSTATGYRLDNLVAGTYTITVKDAKGCEDTKTVIIIDNGSDITLTLEATNVTCNGKGSIWATINGGTAGYSYSWTGPVTGSISTSETGYKIENLPAGTYSITVRDSKGCESTKSVTIQSVGGNLTVTLTTTTAVACAHDGTTDVTISDGKAPYTISYVGVTTGTVTANSDNYQLNLFPGDYTVFVKDSNGCEVSQKIKIYDNGSDLAINLTATGANCDNKGMLQVNISGGISNYQITWSGNGLNETITTGNKSFALTDLAAGTYEVKVTDGIGCAVSKSVTVSNLGGNLGLQLIPKNGTCGQAGAIDVNISGGAATYTISWSGASSGSATSSDAVYQISGLGIGNYEVTVKDANGCEIKETVAINAGSAVDFNLTATDAECNKNGNILVNITKGAPNYAISWTGPSSGSQNVSANVYKIEGLIAGTYNITIKDANGCESTKSVIVEATGSSLGLTLTNTNASCGSNGSITATVTNGEGDYTFSWTVSGSGSGLGSTKVSDPTYTIWDLPAGSYIVSVTDKNGCSISKIIQINNTANELSLNVVGKNASCGQASSIQVTIANGVPDFKIEWSGANTGIFNTSANSYTITNVTNGETIVRVTDASGCSKAQAVIIDANPNDVNFTYQSKDASCDNKGAIWLTISDGTAPYNIAWTGPSSGASISADEAVQITDLDAGVYSVTISDKSNCMITQTIEVNNTGGGTATNFSYKAGAVTCNVSGSVLVTMINGVAPFTVAWSGPTNGSRTASTTDIKIEDLVVGTYQVTVTSANGCGALTQSIVIEDKRVVLGISGTVTNGVCGGKGTVALSWSGDRDPYTISWTGTSVGSITTNDRSQTITDLKDGSYSFTVTGFDGCTGQYQATINNGGTSTSADFTYAISAKKLTFSNLSSTGTYVWDFGDGNTSTETNPIHTYEKNGTYTICLKVTNDCGTKEKCQSLTINAVTSTNGESSAKVVLADKSGPRGTVLQLPVRVENCTRIGTLSGTINLGNNQVAQINGLSPNAISPVYNDANHSFSYLASGTGMNITGETILFYINVQLIGGVGESSTVDLSSLPVALELTCTEDGFTAPITPEVGSGRVSISTNSSALTEVGGSILTYWGDGVADAMVTIRSTDHEMNPMTSLDGDYIAESVPMGYEYEFTPSKTSNPANGLSTFGLFLTQKYILGYTPEQIQSPYQVVAMDANCSGSLTTFDLFAMQQMLVGNLTEFPGCDSWVFVDADYEFPTEFTNKNVFPYPNSHTMMLENEEAIADFIGVKVGDVLGRALPSDDSFNRQATDRNRKVMPLQISAEKAAAGEIIEVHFQAQDFTEMVSFQLGLDFDPTVLELVEFIPNVANELSSALSGGNRNHLNISWYDPAGKGTALVKNEDLFTLKFITKQKITEISELFTINNRTFVSELHQQSNEAYRFKLVNKSPTNSTFKVHQNTPNPFMDATTITIEMPKALDAVIVLHDQFGRTIQTIQQPFNKGMNRVNINRNQLSAGIYYYTVKAGDFTATKRMLIIE